MEFPIPYKFKLDLQNVHGNLLIEIFAIAKKIGIDNLAIVGGYVRDDLLRYTEKESIVKPKDLDLLIEGSAADLAIAIKKYLGDERVLKIRIHSSYNTAELTIDGLAIDLATARCERYEKPGQNPLIKPCKIQEDLKRRDFTINAMAIELSNLQLLDPYEGQVSISKRELQFLHHNSVAEDPTRIIRAARYSARLFFDLAPQALQQIQSTLTAWPWTWRQGDLASLAPPALATRLRLEMNLLLYHEPWEKALTNLQNWGGFILLDIGLQEDFDWKRRLKWASKLGIDMLPALILGAKNAKALAERLQLPKDQQNSIAESLEIQKLLLKFSTEKEYLSWPPSKWTNEIENSNWHQDAIALTICKGGPIWKPLLKWWLRWRSIESPISAKDLINEGWEPGPRLGEELKRLREKELDKYKKI